MKCCLFGFRFFDQFGKPFGKLSTPQSAADGNLTSIRVVSALVTPPLCFTLLQKFEYLFIHRADRRKQVQVGRLARP
jgi:hypothetical protein